jgi:hypothetical protein
MAAKETIALAEVNTNEASAAPEIAIKALDSSGNSLVAYQIIK